MTLEMNIPLAVVVVTAGALALATMQIPAWCRHVACWLMARAFYVENLRERRAKLRREALQHLAEAREECGL